MLTARLVDGPHQRSNGKRNGRHTGKPNGSVAIGVTARLVDGPLGVQLGGEMRSPNLIDGHAARLQRLLERGLRHLVSHVRDVRDVRDVTERGERGKRGKRQEREERE